MERKQVERSRNPLPDETSQWPHRTIPIRPRRTVRLPFNLETGEIIEARWREWQKHDPINLVARHKQNLARLAGIYIDCGWRDQFQIHYGTRILSKRLAASGIAHVYEEFDDDHSGIDYRMERSLPFLVRALRG